MQKYILTGALFASTLATSFLAQADSANAASITYNFRRFDVPLLIDVAPSSFTVDGLTVDVSGNGVVTQTADGLGLARVLSVAPPEQVDGLALNGPDFLDFDFGSRFVNIVSATFRRVGTNVPIDEVGEVGNDDFSLAVDGNSVIEIADIPGGNGLDSGIGTFDFTPLLLPSGNVWRFSAPELDDDYTIASLTVTSEEIPTPAVLPGLIGMGVAFMRKRRGEAADA
ncbi:PTPA-CTERM sorting domain-containing protein [Leptolyngbyaceae cyanobacterium CCMR0082]|uniref:PTPA-CTERM sorting domain-containing protein n=1 Tax=Adonisia turfae CCMR0082 TaxID=2304604 RepID=A0A6M0SFA6_9CYAN|nr:PTPA-CTERM sorting domain-containing protein [Adonisia turfae]MDV3353331.1 PTPA-CTERM sorting domain-containing protein [Leptothoe sp. LEGE 181152]NEZ67159.1 PTPA-CTERM sorting domain-containing protein [Adonisia turfae CCMR0082]